ncbi:DUF4333 domain-containing protein [Streptomyces kunmingensis]|uniref:DUF4333 domain-containing protein n=1 Tax=Streptomyces kunmingensis TaxID=68225 RepID=A0ABU6CCM7_9ACTN|nr:DUF4333 domain-containing protein [Streptomyces kunmingensis]MEB3962209.1 DUF4333 domain-containing protein [Streptomyces kunmingensis]
MIKSRLSAATWALSAVAAGAMLVGCSASVSVGKSDPELSKEKLSDLVAEKLAATTGQPKPDISCPENLKGKVGTTTRCKLTASDGSTLGVTVKVTSVDGDKINFDYEADQTFTPAQS